ncbi:hypothetical protein LTR85_007947 [Meristemomyces frigidus]|nr:hypothetical protein LTR85_007947 [Meristemomyces frigidus]
MRHVYNPLGFSKGYNFIIWFLSLGYLFGFALARTMYFSFYGIFCNPNSQAGNGAAPVHTVDQQSQTLLELALINEQFATIITIRIIMISGGMIISSLGGWCMLRPCGQINFVFGQPNTMRLYPICESYFNGTNLDQRAIVEANYYGNDPNEIAAAFGIPFGAAGWISFWLHAVAVEVYRRLTPAESERLRQVSYERQLRAGFKRPGYAGLVAERFGDANPYVPLEEQEPKTCDDLEVGHSS